MSVDLGAEDMDPSRKIESNVTGWPHDTVLYDAEEIGDFSSGIVAMTESTGRAPDDCWRPENNSVYNPEWFDGSVGYWFFRSQIADAAISERQQEAPWVDLGAEDLDPSRKSESNLIGWPHDTVLYDAEEIGDFSSGIVAMTESREKAPDDCWRPENNSVENPEWFDGSVGYWFFRSQIADAAISERLQEASAATSGSSSSAGERRSGDTEVYAGPGDSTTGDTEIYDGSDERGGTPEEGVSSGTDPSFCPSCGTALAEYSGAAYCPSCGREL